MSEELEQELREAEETIECLKEDLQETEDKVEELKDEISDLEDDVSRLESEVTDLEDKLDACTCEETKNYLTELRKELTIYSAPFNKTIMEVLEEMERII